MTATNSIPVRMSNLEASVRKPVSRDGPLAFIAAFMCVFSVGSIFTNLPGFLYLVGGIEPWISFVFIVAMLSFSALINQQWRNYTGLLLITPIVIFAIINFAYKIFHPANFVRDAAGAYFSSALIGVSVGVALLGNRPKQIAIGLFSAIVVTAIGVISEALLLQDYFREIQPDRVLGRYAFTHTNPNVASEALLCATLLMTYIDPHSKRNYWAFIIIFIPILLTLSRAGLVVYVICLFWFFIYIRKIKFLYFIALLSLLLIIPSIAMSIMSFVLNNASLENQANIFDRMTFFTDFDIVDSSSESRFEYVLIGIKYLLESPITGHFPGFSLTTTPDGAGYHNQFLYLGVDYGIFGLIIFALLLIILFTSHQYGKRGGAARWFGVILIGFSFFSHNIMQSAIWLATISYFVATARAVPVPFDYYLQESK